MFSLISSISSHIGSGEVKFVDRDDPIMNDTHYQQLLVDLSFRPSSLMMPPEKEGEEDDLQEDEQGEDAKQAFFDWHSEFGLDANI